MRPHWHQLYMEMCEILAKRSTCVRIQTASIIVKENIIISVGYNGVPSGEQHCNEYWEERRKERGYSTLDEYANTSEFYHDHHSWSTIHEIHGEMNAILFAGKNSIPVTGATLYTLYSPCIQCAKAILTSGIQNVFYLYIYKRNTDGMELLRKHGITVLQVERP